MRNTYTSIAICLFSLMYLATSLNAEDLGRPPISNDTEVLRYSLKTLAQKVGNNAMVQKIQAMNGNQLNNCVAQLNPEQRHFINNVQRNAWGVLNNQWLAQQMLMQQNMFGGMPFIRNRTNSLKDHDDAHWHSDSTVHTRIIDVSMNTGVIKTTTRSFGRTLAAMSYGQL